MTPEKMAECLWSLANGITAFAALQALIFLYALDRPDFLKALSSWISTSLILALIVGFTVAYSFGVCRCRDLALKYVGSYQAIWDQVTWGRLGCIWTFGVLAALMAIVTRLKQRRVANQGTGFHGRPVG